MLQSLSLETRKSENYVEKGSKSIFMGKSIFALNKPKLTTFFWQKYFFKAFASKIITRDVDNLFLMTKNAIINYKLIVFLFQFFEMQLSEQIECAVEETNLGQCTNAIGRENCKSYDSANWHCKRYAAQ